MSSTALKAVLTGATSGLGLHTLKRLCRSGSFDRIIGIGRDDEKIRLAEQNIRDELPTNETKVEFIKCDLTEPDAVRKAATEICQRLPRIDVLCNNAGIMNHPPSFTEEGVEIHFAANHLGHFLLTTLLLEKMAEDSRIINVSSGFYKQCHEVPSLLTVTSSSNLPPKLLYAQSKLANCLFTVGLAKFISRNADRLPRIKVVAVRPGFIRGTELGRHHNSWLRWLATPLIYLFSKDLNFGTNTIVFLALASAAEIQTGKLYYDRAVEEYTELVTEDAAEQLWTLSESLLQQNVQSRRRHKSDE